MESISSGGEEVQGSHSNAKPTPLTPLERVVRTRFAPSPTGFIHLGNIRSALYPWAFARSRGGVFILRVEDTDVERSSQEAVQIILDSMEWLGFNYDEGPIYQMQRMKRYQEVLEQLRSQGLIYPCYMSVSELDVLREGQLARKEKPRYDGTWRPEPSKILPNIPTGAKPVWRFKNPQDGVVVWEDQVKGRIEVSNTELDDLVVARSDGTPTYNFCVVVDDIDMGITHVIRGDDHINNTPRQINVFHALDYPPPVFAHLPTVLNAEGKKMSKRNGAKAVTQYLAEGYLPEALVNYLARLGWSHGDDEIFSREQFLQWFDLEHLGKSAAQFDEAKLRWVNAQHMKSSSAADLAKQLQPLLHSNATDLDLVAVCALFQDRCDTLVQIADWVERLLGHTKPNAAEQSQYLKQEIRPALEYLGEQLQTCEWTKESIAAALKATLKNGALKMPQLAIPVRVALLGQAQSPSLDTVIALLSREEILLRLRKVVYF